MKRRGDDRAGSRLLNPTTIPPLQSVMPSIHDAESSFAVQVSAAPVYAKDEIESPICKSRSVSVSAASCSSWPDAAFPAMPNETALEELHRIGTTSLLLKPGDYRDCPVSVRDGHGTLVYQPPPHTDVETLMREFFVELHAIWKTGDALDAAAFALWRYDNAARLRGREWKCRGCRQQRPQSIGNAHLS
jgi:hypothetical protein